MFSQIEKTLKAANNEGTSAPYWLILDPQQNMRRDVHCLAGQITGPFFCREDAQEELDKTRYNYSDRARVYCCSGCYSSKYMNLCKNIGI